MFTDLEPTINEPEVFVENSDERVNARVIARTDKDRTTSVAGDDLWLMSTFFSKNKRGRGERIKENEQVLDPSQSSLDLLQGDDLIFDETLFQVDLDVTCDEIPFLCFELTKNPESSINYQFEGELLKCLDISSRCNGGYCFCSLFISFVVEINET